MVEITDADGDTKLVKITEDELDEIIAGERRIDVTTGDGRRHSVGYDYITDNRYDGVKYDTTPYTTRSWEKLRSGEKEEIHWNKQNIKLRLNDDADGREVIEVPRGEMLEMGKEIAEAAKSGESITIDGTEIKPADDGPDWGEVIDELDSNNNFAGGVIQAEDRDGNDCLYVYTTDSKINHVPEGWYADYDATIDGGGITFYPEE